MHAVLYFIIFLNILNRYFLNTYIYLTLLEFLMKLKVDNYGKIHLFSYITYT